MRVSEIWRYPLKSAQGERVPRSAVTELGLEWDRQLAVIDVGTGRALTARREPALLMLSAVVDGSGVRIVAPDGRSLASDDDLSAWFGRSVRLARPPTDRAPEYENPTDFEDESGPWQVWTGSVGVWHDSARTRLSILSTVSLRDWPVRRFRPNVVVDIGGEDELVGRRIGLGSAVLDVTKRIDRCVMVTRPQPGGIERDLSVLKAVLRETDGFRGVGAVVVESGTFSAGDPVCDLGPSDGTPRR
jgi:uncharacterized protein YcbX